MITELTWSTSSIDRILSEYVGWLGLTYFKADNTVADWNKQIYFPQ